MQFRLLRALFPLLLVFSASCTKEKEEPNSPPPPLDQPAPTSTDVPDPIDGPPGESPKQLTSETNTFNSFNPQIASNASGMTYVVWQQCLFGDSCNKETIMVAKQNGDGTFANPIEVSPVHDGSANASSPGVVVDTNGIAHITWLDDGSVGERSDSLDVVYRTLDGETFSSIETISQTGILPSQGSVGAPNIVLSDGVPYVVFHGYVENSGTLRTYEIVLASRGRDGTWNNMQLSDERHDGSTATAEYFGSTNPSIASDTEGTAHIVWQNRLPDNAFQVHYRSLNIFGSLSIIELIDEGIEQIVPAPKITLSESEQGHTTHITWQYPRMCESGSTSGGVKYTARANGDASFAASQEVTPQSFCAAGSKFPVIANTPDTTESGVVVLWTSPSTEDGLGADRDIYMVSVTQGVISNKVVSINEYLAGQNTSNTDSDGTTATVTQGTLTACWHEKDVQESSTDLDIFCTRRPL